MVYASAYWPKMPPVAKSIHKPMNQAVPTLHWFGARSSQNKITNSMKSGRKLSAMPDHGNSMQIKAASSDR